MRRSRCSCTARSACAPAAHHFETVPLIGTSLTEHARQCGRVVNASAFLVMQHRSPPFGREAHSHFYQSFFRRKPCSASSSIKKDERALLFRKGDFVTLLHAGEHRYFDPFMRLTVEKYPLAQDRVRSPPGRLPASRGAGADRPRVPCRRRRARPKSGCAIENGLLVEVLAPNTQRLYWKGYIDVRVARIDIGENVRAAA